MIEQGIAAIAAWLDHNPLCAFEIDCAIAVKLKIMDGKCKMTVEDKIVMSALYSAILPQSGKLMGEEMHEFIRDSESRLNEDLKNEIYEKRVLAETMISRPVMKAFKKRLRQQGLFDAYEGAIEEYQRVTA